jgi:hypothetical protein
MHLQSSFPQLSFQRKLKVSDVVLVKCILVLQFLIDLTYTPDWLYTLNIMSSSPCTTSISAPTWHTFFTLVIDFGLMQFYPQ